METLARRPAPGLPGVFDVPVMRIDAALVVVGTAGLAGSVRAAHLGVDGMLEALATDDEGVDPAALRRDLAEVERLRRRVDAARLRLIARAERARLGERAGFVDTGSWLAGATKGDRPPAASDVHLAEALGEVSGGGKEAGAGTGGAGAADGAARGAEQEGSAGSDGSAGPGAPEGAGAPECRPRPRLRATGQALDEGTISAAHAKVIARALDELPEWVTTEQRRTCEAELVRMALSRSPSQLRRAGRRVLDQIEPDPAAVDAHEDAVTASEEEAAHDRAAFWIKDNRDGTMTGQFTVPWASGMVLKKVIDAMTAPRRLQAAETGSDSDSDPGRRWAEMDWQHRRGLALADLLLRIPTDHLSTKIAATLLVTTRLEDLQDGTSVRVGSTDSGDVVSAGTVRRLACGSGIIPAVLGSDSVPLDLGRQVRLFTEQQRLALASLYTECAAEGCDRPFAWCEAHHLHRWHAGGTTDLANAVPLCGRHHRMTESPSWRHRATRQADRTWRISFTRRE